MEAIQVVTEVQRRRRWGNCIMSFLISKSYYDHKKFLLAISSAC